MTRTPNVLSGARRGLFPAAALLLGLACDPELTDDLEDDVLEGLAIGEHTTPGGSHCKGCIRDFAVADGRLYLCVDTSLGRIRPWLPFLPASQLSTWYTSMWSIQDRDSGDALCPDCTFQSIPVFSSGKSAYALVRSQPLPAPVSEAPAALWLRSLSFPSAIQSGDGTAFHDIITAEVDDIDGPEFHCPPLGPEIQPILTPDDPAPL